jgi:hypothetical protein
MKDSSFFRYAKEALAKSPKLDSAVFGRGIRSGF